jgi:hypothetical protein
MDTRNILVLCVKCFTNLYLDSSRSRDSDRKSHSTDRKSHDRSKTQDVGKKVHDKKGENKDEYDPAEPTEDEEVQLTEVSWVK